MMQVIIHHFHHYNRARQDCMCCHVTNSCYFFVFHLLSGCQGCKWVLFLEWNVSSQVKSYIIKETRHIVRQKFYNQTNKTRQTSLYIHKSYANLKLQNGSLCNIMISLTSYQTTERVSLAELSLRARGRGFSPVTMSVSPGYFHRKQKENRTQRTS